MSHLHDDLTPQLIRAAVPVLIRWINLTTATESAEHFDKQCHLLGECIIGGVWIYAARDLSTIEASLNVLPSVMSCLGIGTVRYLKVCLVAKICNSCPNKNYHQALIPQCIHILTMDPALQSNVAPVFRSALVALQAVIKQCRPRIYRWKGTIIEGVAKSWVMLMDTESNNSGNV